MVEARRGRLWRCGVKRHTNPLLCARDELRGQKQLANPRRGRGLATSRRWRRPVRRRWWCSSTRIANPIYREVIPRALTWAKQVTIPHQPAGYVRPDGGLDLAALLEAFQSFWRKDGHLAAQGFSYTESGPHLVLMVFWGEQRYAIELKLRRDTETEREALAQITRYLDSAGLDEGWLVIFDLRSRRSWAKKIFARELQVDGKRVHLLGC